MRSKIAVFLLFSAAFLSAQTSFERKKFFFGASFGTSYLSLSSDLIGDENTFGGSAPNMKFGWMISQKTAVAVLLPGTVYSFKSQGRVRDRGFEGIIPVVQLWPKDRWWIMGGGGLGMDAPAFYDIKDESERKFYFGAAAVAGTGFEIWRRKHFALDIQGRAHMGFVDAPEGRRNGMAFSVLLGVNWY
jgi:hypothetical protein